MCIRCCIGVPDDVGGFILAWSLIPVCIVAVVFLILCIEENHTVEDAFAINLCTVSFMVLCVNTWVTYDCFLNATLLFSR